MVHSPPCPVRANVRRPAHVTSSRERCVDRIPRLSRRSTGHPGIVLATLSLANVMALLDLFVVNVALHDIGVGLH